MSIASSEVFDFGLFDDFGEEFDLPESVVVPSEDLAPYWERSKNYWMQVPMPPELAPTGGAPLRDLDDETLLTMSPTLLVHAQRTAASGGIQVLSPRTVPLAACAARTMERKRASDMFIVGCNASTSAEWPVVRDPVPAHLFPGEPIDAYPYDPALRMKTRSTGILTAAAREENPVTRALLIGRALVDLQRRADVAGSGDVLSQHIASAWGIPHEVYESLAQASLAPQGPLLRYAVRADDAYPILNAPIHARKCISVGANATGRAIFGEDAAVDWRRIRVLAEAVFYMSSRLEGYTLAEMSLMQPPGDPRADPTRPGVLQFRPLPGSVWSHSASTFRLDISDTTPVSRAVELPQKVNAALDSFMESARPIALAALDPSRVDLVPTARKKISTTTGDTIVRGYETVMKRALNFSSRGKSSVAAIRDFMYGFLSGTNTLANTRALWLARYLGETARSAGLSTLIDSVLTRQLGSRFSDMALDMRVKLANESLKRGSDLESWWSDVASMLPADLSKLNEGSASWAIAVAHFLLFPYSHKWSGLTKALAISSHRAMADVNTRQVRLPAKLRSQARVLEAAQATCRSLASSYGAYYGAMYDVGRMLSAAMKRKNLMIAAEKLDIAALMWDVRSKLAATAEIRVAESGEVGTLGTKTGPYTLHVSPYSAYTRLREHVMKSKSVTRAVKSALPHHVEGPVSAIFSQIRGPIAMGTALEADRMFRYYRDVSQLGLDMEQTMRMMHDDLEATISSYELEDAPIDAETPVEVHVTPWNDTFSQLRPAMDSYWMTLTQLDQDAAIEVDETVGMLDPDVAAGIMNDSYLNGEELYQRVIHLMDRKAEERARVRDMIV